jgi:hypothetical protein
MASDLYFLLPANKRKIRDIEAANGSAFSLQLRQNITEGIHDSHSILSIKCIGYHDAGISDYSGGGGR